MFFQQPELKGRPANSSGRSYRGLQHCRAIDCIPAPSRCRVFTIHQSGVL